MMILVYMNLEYGTGRLIGIFVYYVISYWKLRILFFYGVCYIVFYERNKLIYGMIRKSMLVRKSFIILRYN